MLVIPIKIKTQPDDMTCGPTSLHAVYAYYRDQISLKQVISEVSYLEDGGTLGVLLADHAIKRGYSTTIYSYNLDLFDPTWAELSSGQLIGKLRTQIKYKSNPKLKQASNAYIDYLKLGGELNFDELTPALLKKYFRRNIPILAGLSSTYLYKSKREYTYSNGTSKYDDIRGTPMGHFVVLCGYDHSSNRIIIADPYSGNPVAKDNYYTVEDKRVINSILLGIVTYDANLVVIQPGTDNRS